MTGFIYKITNDFNEKVYIGQTSRTILERWKEHCTNCMNDNNLEYKNKFHRSLRKHGIEHFHIEVLVKITAKTVSQLRDSLNWTEIYYIQKFDSYKNGYNSTLGGDINPMWGIKGINHPSSIKINQYDINGNFIKTWNSIADISRTFNKDASNLSKVCNPKFNNKITQFGYIWRYYSDYPECTNIIISDEEVYFMHYSKKKTQFESKKVVQYDLLGNFIKIWDSVSEAARNCNGNAGAITNVCKGIKKMHKKYMWMYYDADNLSLKINPYHK